MTEDETSQIARLGEQIKGVADDVGEIKAGVATIAADQGAAAVELGRLQERGKVANARIANLERNQRWLVILVLAAVAETVLRQTGLLG